jgi:hypothetical protein
VNKTRALPPTALTGVLDAFADGLEAAGIDPRQVEVSLLLSWQHLARTLDNEGTNPTGRIELGSVRYLVMFAAKGAAAPSRARGAAVLSARAAG